MAVLAELAPGTDVLLNQAFTPDELKLRLGSYTILHLAAHGAFVSGLPEESFIVFGDESQLNLTQIELQWSLPNADLVVLSACETAVGSPQLGDGVEILGLGFQIQKAGAKAVVASLWPVSDGGTQVLMNGFYSAMIGGKTKAEALQQAQQLLIGTGSGPVSPSRGGFEVVMQTGETPEQAWSRLSHPFY